MTITEVLQKTDWPLLAEQKKALVALALNEPAESPIDGLLCWIDELQDAAEEEGYPVLFLTEEEEQGLLS